jgi:hypothetical protein
LRGTLVPAVPCIAAFQVLVLLWSVRVGWEVVVWKRNGVRGVAVQWRFSRDLSDGSAARDDTTRCTTHLRPEVSPRKGIRGSRF